MSQAVKTRHADVAPVVGGMPPRRRWLGVALIALGVGAAFIALLGPLVAGLIRYHASQGALNQVAGGDVAALVLVAPISIVAGILVLRGHRAGPVLALGPAVYAIYTYTQLALGVDVARYPGNSERFFPLFVGLFVLGAAVAIRAWTTVDPSELPSTSQRVDRTLGVFLLVVAAFLTFGLHLPGMVDAMGNRPVATEYLADPFLFWLVKFMDLGIIVPALVVIGVGILRGAGWAHKAVYAAVGWFALLGSAVAGMAVVMQGAGDAAASTANTLAFTLFAAVGLSVAVIVYRPLFGRATPRREEARRHPR
jgi:hypothetical protein